MEQIFFVKNGDLSEVNKLLKKGGKVKMIQATSETVSAYAGTETSIDGLVYGTIYAYIVVEMPM